MAETEHGGDNAGTVVVRKRRRHDDGTRRSRNACSRCKSKKLRCHYDLDDAVQSKCVACSKSKDECVFDILPDGVPRSAAYIAELESKIRALESERRSPAVTPSELDMGIRSQSAGGDNHAEAAHSPSADLQPAALIFNLIPGRYTSSPGALPVLPPDSAAKQLVEAAYLYTQARYCIVDWVQVRKWHQQRESICYATRQEDDQIRIGAFFVWIIYAIGARLASHSEYSYTGYFNRALQYLDAVLQPQDLSSLQALLCLIQYNCRVSGGPSHWSLVGTAMRLCVELGYHRRPSSSSSPQRPPRTIELEKRFFWCAYCFDRMVSIASRRPFSIHDLDLDVNYPVDIDVSSTNDDTIRDLQLQQESGGSGSIPGTITSLSTALHHLLMYRIQSRIYQRFTGPYALPPTYEDVNSFLVELDHWKQKALQKQLSSVPQQSTERVQTTYLQTVLLLFRPVLDQSVVDSDLLRQCANFAADACENAKALSVSPQSQSSPVITSNCFHCGITLLHCLSIEPTVMSLRRGLRAISACSSALAVYSRVISMPVPLLQLFDILSDRLLGKVDDGASLSPNPGLRLILRRLIHSSPTETADIAQSLSTEDPDEGLDATREFPNSLEFALDRQTEAVPPFDPTATYDLNDFTMPFEAFIDPSACDSQFAWFDNLWASPDMGYR